ncbi:MAG: linoleoyl-CoA desaturase [Patescibacteria group bacterium]|jgi:linoleoyl-CoA desaturase|nr:linoleoyl-CoA desaturase [Patescibacteria group bacterium]
MKTFSVKELGLKNKSTMAKEIIRQVNDYFSQNNISKKGNWKLYFKSAFFFFGFWFIWYLLVYTNLHILIKIFLCPLEAWFASGIGFCIMHDGNHGAFSKYELVNKSAGATSECLGVSCGIWKTKHNIVHHDGVNVLGVDEDVEARPLLCLHEGQKRYWIHKYQHWYWPFAYSLLYIIWPLKDFFKYFSGKVMGTRLRFKIADHILFWTGKIFFAFMIVVIPINEIGFEHWVIGFLLFAMPLGFLLSVVFQPAHIVRGVKSSMIEEAHDGDSTEHQLTHTANFAPDNQFITWWTGGLNYQIDHHVFRKVSHVHYPVIHKIIKSVCENYDFSIIVFPTARAALASHIGKLKDLSEKPKEIVVQL